MHWNSMDHKDIVTNRTAASFNDAELQRILSNFIYFRFYYVFFLPYFCVGYFCSWQNAMKWILRNFVSLSCSQNTQSTANNLIGVVVVVIFTKDEFQTQLYNSQGYIHYTYRIFFHIYNALFFSISFYDACYNYNCPSVVVYSPGQKETM